jgi:hypothetical protein
MALPFGAAKSVERIFLKIRDFASRDDLKSLRLYDRVGSPPLSR